VQEQRLHDEGNPLLSGQRFGGLDAGQGQFRLASIQMDHCCVGNRYLHAEGMGKLLAKCHRFGNACDRPVGIAEQPVELRASLESANARIVSAVEMPMGSV
jgi:hypothetical protein